MKLKDWNQSLSYAESCVKRLEDAGLKAHAFPYATYNNKKGIKLCIVDNVGHIQDTYYSGIQTCYDYMERVLEMGTNRLIKDHV